MASTFCKILCCGSIWLALNNPAANGVKAPPAPPPPSDPRFFGTYYGSFLTEVCKKYRVTFLGITIKKGTKCRSIKVKNIWLHLNYQELPVGGVFSGRGEGSFEGNRIPVAMAGNIVKTGMAWGMVNLMLPKYRTERGYAYLSKDGLALTIPVMGRKIVLRKDAGPNTAPQVKITVPSPGQSLDYGTTYPFSATVADAQQKFFPYQRLIWKSDRDGVLTDKGASIYTNSLSPGKHLITFEAMDDGGLTATDSVSIAVVNHPPDKPEIAQPLTKDQLYTLSPILFQGKAYDFEDGWLTGSALAWSSNKEGFLGNGKTLNRALKMSGEHLIRLTATDKNNLSNYVERRIILDKYTGNSPPQVTIDAPKHLDYAAIAVQSGKEITFRGTAKDLEDSFDKLKLEWRISEVSSSGFGLAPKVMGTGDKVTYKLMTTGSTAKYVITFTARDTGGLEGQANMQIVVMAWTIK